MNRHREFLLNKSKPNFKTLGPRFGKSMKQIAGNITKFDQQTINSIERNGSISLEIEGKNVELSREDFEISTRDIAGWLVASENELTVALDIQVDDDLKVEGIARELVNRIQNLRKDSGFEVSDKITIALEKQAEIEKAISLHKDYICDEVLAAHIKIRRKSKGRYRN